ncbi:unnamed protein product [Adineta steineri]|uniref:G-protein coupled receptors family 1 profile domain-containing protein n=2 Tax=Adineta steineri TaxID=433720 RepID=A0A814Y5K7_9BILA|nr:unnamed protein product [Adineta steineri]CAF1224444.1 unnamed protein product [Adineta steineri]CAF3960114.1 unnamed protein product [Adineta steineri]CAF4233426.1 unnamed protein product [Adineta steineri]
MAATANAIFTYYTQQVAIYVGFPVLIAGIIGETLNIIVFMSLHTFRQNSCAFYLLIMSCVNIGQLISGLFTRILIAGFGIDWTLSSLFYCKFRAYCRQVCALISLSCFCFATIDQFLATSFRAYWQQWSNIKVAQRLCLITSVIWILHGIPCLIYFNIIQSTTTGSLSCIPTNAIFNQYYIYAYSAGLAGYLPIIITILFGSLAYYNVRQIAYRTVPLVRRELDKQLTVMVLILDIINIIPLVPYAIILILTSVIDSTQNPVLARQIQFASDSSIILYYVHYGVG